MVVAGRQARTRHGLKRRWKLSGTLPSPAPTKRRDESRRGYALRARRRHGAITPSTTTTPTSLDLSANPLATVIDTFRFTKDRGQAQITSMDDLQYVVNASNSKSGF